MRSMKTIALAALLTSAAIASATAQGPRPFRDSWFWGVHGGLATYVSSDVNAPAEVGTRSFAPELGLDWLITRKTGGLYVSFGQAFVTTTGAVPNGPTSADSGFRVVDVKNLRRLNLAGVMFPGDFIRLHPYIGGGMTFGYIGAVAPQFTTTDLQSQRDFAATAVQEHKAGIGPLFIVGAQYRLPLFSAFGQMTASAMSRDFLLANGRPIAFGFEFGLRYNVGSSIDKQF
jgi:hypothetical protein